MFALIAANVKYQNDDFWPKSSKAPLIIWNSLVLVHLWNWVELHGMLVLVQLNLEMYWKSRNLSI